MAVVRNTMGVATGFKARLVMGGNLQRDITVDLATTNPAFEEMLVFVQLAINEGLVLTTMDVQNAYLNSPNSEKLSVRLVKEAGTEFAAQSEDFARHQKPDGSILCDAAASVYGFRNGPIDFQKFFNAAVKKEGFESLKASASIYRRTLPNGKSDYLYVFVDDVLHAYPPGERDVAFMQEFSGFTEHLDSPLEFLGVRIEIAPGNATATLSQPGYTDEVISAILGKDDNLYSDRPCIDTLFTPPKEDVPRLSPAEAKLFASNVMKMSYLSNRTRCDLKPVTSFLSSRISDPMREDHAKLVKAARYLKSTRMMSTTLHRGATELRAEADASWGLFPDARPQLGHIIWMGGALGAPILTVCKRGDAAMTSSTHAESTACFRAASDVFHLRNLLEGLGYKQTKPSRKTT